MSRDFSELDLQLVMYDFSDTEDEREDNVVAGVAIRAEDAEAFAADVEKLAVEKYGGATTSRSTRKHNRRCSNCSPRTSAFRQATGSTFCSETGPTPRNRSFPVPA